MAWTSPESGKSWSILSQCIRHYPVKTFPWLLIPLAAALNMLRIGEEWKCPRGTKSGHTYHLARLTRAPKKLFEPFLISLKKESEWYCPILAFPVSQFIFMLEGRLEYSGWLDERYILNRATRWPLQWPKQPHRPEGKIKKCRYQVIWAI